ncbi:ECF transporter S component [bacterium]|nr:ECF transporter S component [bacterium]
MRIQSQNELKKITLSSIIIALAIALGYALAFIPNVELVTFTLAFGGAILGYARGPIIGALGFLLYSILSPYGMAPPPLIVAQVLGGAVIGLGGAILGRSYKKMGSRWIFILISLCVGLISTFIYDLLTNLGSYIVVATSATLIPFLIGGISFSLIHIASNSMIFAILFPAILRLTRKFSELAEH